MAKLDDPQLRAALVIAVTNGMTTAQAAAHVGTTRQTVRTYAARNTEFRMELDSARHTRANVEHAAARELPATVATSDPRTLQQRRDDLEELLWKHARDGESRACSKAVDVLATILFGGDIHAQKLEAARRAAATEDDARPEPLQVRFIAPGQTKHPRVLDAEVVNAKHDDGG